MFSSQEESVHSLEKIGKLSVLLKIDRGLCRADFALKVLILVPDHLSILSF